MTQDFFAYKNNYIKSISENFNVQFRAEFFNILNHTNFALPVTPDNTDIFDASGAPTASQVYRQRHRRQQGRSSSH
jgi:hypothetical protein